MSLAGDIRQIAKELKEFRIKDLSKAMKVRTYQELRAIECTIRDFLRRDEIEKIGQGMYRYKAKKGRPTLRQRLWDISRRMISFSLRDLEQISSANLNSIKEFCSWMVRAGYARRIKPGQFKITKSLGPVVPKASRKPRVKKHSGNKG
jgi:hypothetical protein